MATDSVVSILAAKLDERKKDWPMEDEEREQARTQNELEPRKILFIQFVPTGDDNEEDLARLLEKLYLTFDFEHHFPINRSKTELARLLEYATDYGERQQNPNIPGHPFYWANLKVWQTRLDYKRTQIPEAVRSLRELVESRDTILSAVETLFNRFRLTASLIWKESFDTLFVLRFFAGEGLIRKLEERNEFYSSMEKDFGFITNYFVEEGIVPAYHVSELLSR